MYISTAYISPAYLEGCRSGKISDDEFLVIRQSQKCIQIVILTSGMTRLMRLTELITRLTEVDGVDNQVDRG